jgi:hypothetical protein
MRCSHALPYEAQCRTCFVEAMGREALRTQLDQVETSTTCTQEWHNPTLRVGQLYWPTEDQAWGVEELKAA